MDLSKHRLLAGTLGVALVALAASFLSPAAVAEPPDHASSVSPAEEAASVAWTDLDWHDAARGRDVPARLYLPTGDGPHALVVFSHGIGGSRAGYSYLGRHFAEQGIASLHVQHVGSDRSLWAGNPLTLVARLHGAAQESEAMHRARDLSFALDRLLAGPHGAAVDAQRIAVAGHSYGANTAMLATGARVVRDGRAIELRDARFKAALLLSSPPFYGERDLAAVLRRRERAEPSRDDHRRRDPHPGLRVARERPHLAYSMRSAASARRWRCSRAARTACSPTASARGAACR